MSEEKAAQLLERAVRSLNYRQYGSAIDDAREALKLHPGHPDAYSVLGVALSRSGRREEAEEALREALRLLPQSAKAHLNLAVHLFGARREGEARELAEQALAIEPELKTAKDLLDKIEKGGTVPPEPAEPRIVKPTHSLGFVARLGLIWDFIGWGVFIAAGIVFFSVNKVLVSLTQGNEHPGQPSEVVLKAIQENSPLLMKFLVVYGLFALWWTIDLFDRRPPTGLVVACVLGLVGVFCCPYYTVVAFPMYGYIRNRMAIASL